MLEEIALITRETRRETGVAEISGRVIAALDSVPRHEFVPPAQQGHAYENRPLPIGEGQTISQPFIVALMTELMALKPTDRVLEVGTGSGYQAAVLGRLVAEVYTIELLEHLGREAANRLKKLGYSNVHPRVGDGYQGWPEHAPYDAIIVTAAPRSVPQPLVAQLKPGGRMVVPVGGEGVPQNLLVIEKLPDGRTSQHIVLGVRFVPLNDPSGRQQ